MPRYVATSIGISRNPSVAGLLGGPLPLVGQRLDASDITVGWGRKKSGARAQELGAKAQDHLLLEDGFLRSVGRRDFALGINFDRDGIYYDARSNSRLFDLIRQKLNAKQRARALTLMQMWRDFGLSKYNDAPPPSGPLPERYVLLIDQVRNDLSIPYGLADEASFQRMLDTALADNPDATILLKIHPDSLADPAKRHFDIHALADNPRIRVLAEPCHVALLIERAEAVYCVTSQVGFEALIWGKPVHVFGMPFYAGWGLTHDKLERPKGRCDVSIEQLVHAALVDYPRYWNPVRLEEIEAEDAMALVGVNRQLRTTLPPVIFATGFSPWKRPFIRDFLTWSEVRFVKREADIPKGATLLLWGMKDPPAGRQDLELLRIEDGFLRSSGLGADLVRPLSLVIDQPGIYYDATRPNRLESMLQGRDYDDAERARAVRLRQAILDARLNKYNLGGASWQRPANADHVVLVVGQVEGDASIRFGSPEVMNNLELLRRVRAAHPDSYIVYKPHPDVVAGLREAGSDAQGAGNLYDEMLVDTDPADLLGKIDRLHTMTSLMGFEALLRGVPVTCHGRPFYAGWGLTEDLLQCERRGRQRTIDELVHAVLIDYPRYYSPRGQMFAAPEDILVELADLAAHGPVTRSLPRKLLRHMILIWRRISGRG